jgi:hypothetical protein
MPITPEEGLRLKAEARARARAEQPSLFGAIRRGVAAVAKPLEVAGRTLGLPVGVVGAGLSQYLDPFGTTPAGQWLPNIEGIPDAFSAFGEELGRGDWDEAIAAYQDELEAGKGFWGAAELAGSFIPTGGPFLAGGKLLGVAPGLAKTIAGVAPRIARPGVEAGIRGGLTGAGKVLRAPWQAEEAVGRGVAKGLGFTGRSVLHPRTGPMAQAISRLRPGRVAEEAVTPTAPPGPLGAAVDAPAGEVGLQMDLGAGGPGRVPKMPSDAAASTVPPENVGGSFLGDIPTFEETVPEVVSRGNRVVRALAGSSGINPSVLENTVGGKAAIAHARITQAAHEMTEVGVIAGLDTHATQWTGGMGRALPIDPDTGILKGTGVLWQDVFENPGKYSHLLAGETKAYIRNFNQLIEEMNDRLVARGLAKLPTGKAGGKFYVPRYVEAAHGLDVSRLTTDRRMQRIYEMAIDGWNAGIQYDKNPRATAELFLNSGWREIIEDELKHHLAENLGGLTLQQLAGKGVVRSRDRARGALVAAKDKLRALKLVPEAARRTGAIKAAENKVAALKKVYDRSQQQYVNAMSRARKRSVVPGSLFGRAEKYIKIKDWHGKFYPIEEADRLRATFTQVAGQLESGPSPVARLINTMRTGASVGDFAMPFIQGQLILFRNPVAWGKMTARHYQAFADPTVQARMIADNLDDFQWLARNNVPVGDPEFFAGAIRGQGLGLENIARYAPGVSKRLGKQPAAAAARRTLRAIGRQTFGRFQTSYNVGLGMARVQMLKALKPGWKGTDAELAQHLRNLTGGLDSAALGVGPGQRNAEAMFLAFSPRLLRSTVALTYDAMTAVVGIGTGRGTTAQGRAALLALGAWVSGIYFTYITSGIALGKTWEEIQRGMNPLEGGKYLSHEINGDWVGVGGLVRALLQMMAHIGSAIAPGGEKLSSLWTGGIMQNPLVRAYFYRAAPGTNLALTGLELVTAEDVHPFEEIDTPIDWGKHMWQSAIPFALQGMMEGEQATTVGIAMAGARTGITRPESAVYELTLDIRGEETNYFDLPKHPDVIDYVKRQVPVRIRGLVDEWVEADFDARKELERRGDFRDIRDAYRVSARPNGLLYNLRWEFREAAGIEWRATMARQGKSFPGHEALRDRILELEEKGWEFPSFDYSQWYRRGDTPVRELIRR